MPNRVGRPTKLNKIMQENIVNYLKMGNFLETAAAFSGLNVSTVRRWITRGRREMQRLEANLSSKIKQSEVPYVDFCAAIERADAEAEIRFVSLIYQAAKADPNFAWKMLMSGRYPRWKNNGAQIVDIATDTIPEIAGPDDIAAIRDKLTRRLLKFQGLPTDAYETMINSK